MGVQSRTRLYSHTQYWYVIVSPSLACGKARDLYSCTYTIARHVCLSRCVLCALTVTRKVEALHKVKDVSTSANSKQHRARAATLGATPCSQAYAQYRAHHQAIHGNANITAERATNKQREWECGATSRRLATPINKPSYGSRLTSCCIGRGNRVLSQQ